MQYHIKTIIHPAIDSQDGRQVVTIPESFTAILYAEKSANISVVKTAHCYPTAKAAHTALNTYAMRQQA